MLAGLPRVAERQREEAEHQLIAHLAQGVAHRARGRAAQARPVAGRLDPSPVGVHEGGGVAEVLLHVGRRQVPRELQASPGQLLRPGEVTRPDLELGQVVDHHALGRDVAPGGRQAEIGLQQRPGLLQPPRPGQHHAEPGPRRLHEVGQRRRRQCERPPHHLLLDPVSLPEPREPELRERVGEQLGVGRSLRPRDRRLGVVQEALAVAGAHREDRPRELDPHAQPRLLAGFGASPLENAEAGREIAGAGHVRDPPERLGARGTGGKGGDQLVEHRLRRRPVARREQVVRGCEAAPGPVGAVGVGREPARLPSQLRRRVGRSSLRHLPRDLLEAGRQAVVRSVGPQRQVQGALGRVGDPAGEIPVHRSPLARRRRRVDRGPVERVAEAHGIAGTLDEPGRHGRLELVAGGVEQLHRRPRQRRDLEQRPPRPPVQTAHPLGDQPAQRLGNPSRLAWREARARQHQAAELEGVQRVPPDRSSTARSRARGRARPRRSRSIRPSAPRSIGPSSIRWTRSGPSASSSRAGAAPPSCRRVATSHTGEPPRRRAAKPSARALGSSSHWRSSIPRITGPRRAVSSRARRTATETRRCMAARAVRLGAEQHGLERPRLRGGQRRQRLVGEVRQEVDERGERERGLGLGRARRGRPEPAAACLLEPLAPERRLADPGPARDHERPRPLGAVEEGADLGQLALATEQLGHRSRVYDAGSAKGSPRCREGFPLMSPAGRSLLASDRPDVTAPGS